MINNSNEYEIWTNYWKIKLRYVISLKDLDFN